MNVGRLQLELLNVGFGQLLSRSNPYHLCLLCIHLESVAAHPWFNFLGETDKPSNSCPCIQGSSAEMDLCIIGIRVSLHVLLLDDIHQYPTILPCTEGIKVVQARNLVGHRRSTTWQLTAGMSLAVSGPRGRILSSWVLIQWCRMCTSTVSTGYHMVRRGSAGVWVCRAIIELLEQVVRVIG